MPASLTFGSFGDIITTIQIAQQLYKALGESRGSAKRYQELRQDLDGYIRVLTLVSYAVQRSLQSLNRLGGFDVSTI